MHEFSIVNALLEMCEQNAKEHNMAKVTKVEIKIGKLSGVEPHLLESAFNTFKEDSMCANAEFLMYVQEVVIHCPSCDKELPIQNNVFECPICKNSDCRVVDGEDMYLMRLEME